MASAMGPVGGPPALGAREFQKNEWFQICAALLKRPPAGALSMMSSSEALSHSVPLIMPMSLVT